MTATLSDSSDHAHRQHRGERRSEILFTRSYPDGLNICGPDGAGNLAALLLAGRRDYSIGPRR
jgi:hypothetical protein